MAQAITEREFWDTLESINDSFLGSEAGNALIKSVILTQHPQRVLFSVNSWVSALSYALLDSLGRSKTKTTAAGLAQLSAAGCASIVMQGERIYNAVSINPSLYQVYAKKPVVVLPTDEEIKLEGEPFVATNKELDDSLSDYLTMTKEDRLAEFACAALQTLDVQAHVAPPAAELLAESAFNIAEAMYAELEKRCGEDDSVDGGSC